MRASADLSGKHTHIKPVTLDFETRPLTYNLPGANDFWNYLDDKIVDKYNKENTTTIGGVGMDWCIIDELSDVPRQPDAKDILYEVYQDIIEQAGTYLRMQIDAINDNPSFYSNYDSGDFADDFRTYWYCK